MSLWKTIAKNEIRLATYRFRKQRKLFLVSIFSLALFWAIYLGPNLFDIILPEYIKIFAIESEYFFIEFVEYFFMTIFILHFMIPLYNLYKKKEIGYMEILLASPAKPGDLFLGFFLWKMPFYLLGVLGFGPFITALLNQFKILNFGHYIIVYINVFILSILGLLIGKGIGNFLENKMAKNKSSNEHSRQLIYFFTILIVILLYLIRYLFHFLFDNPEFKNWLMFYPSFWYSNIILFSIDPLLISSYLINIWISLILAITIPLLIFYISYKKVNPTFALDVSIKKSSSVKEIKTTLDNQFRKILPRKWEALTLVQFKEFSRKKEIKTKMIYYVVFFIVMGFFISIGFNYPANLIRYDLNYIKNMIILITSWMGGLFFGMLIGTNVFISSKDVLYLFKRSPRGVRALIKSYLLMNFYLILVLDIILTIVFAIFYQFNIFEVFLYFSTHLMYSEIVLLQAVGIQCFKPLFKERQRAAFFNSYILISIQFLTFFITLSIFVPSIPVSIEKFEGLYNILLIQLFLSIPLSYFLFSLGVQKLEKME